MTTPSPTCQNLVMRELDGVWRVEECWAKAMGFERKRITSPMCLECVAAAAIGFAAEDRASEHYAARRGKA